MGVLVNCEGGAIRFGAIGAVKFAAHFMGSALSNQGRVHRERFVVVR